MDTKNNKFKTIIEIRGIFFLITFVGSEQSNARRVTAVAANQLNYDM